MSDQEPNVGHYLKQVRLAKGWSLRQAAKAIGIAHSRVDEVERMIDGRSNLPFVPSYMTLVRMAKGYGLSPDEVLLRAGYEPGIELEPDEWALIRGFRGMPPERRQRLLVAMREIQNEGSVETPPSSD
jgi:transcriptional regulator with XRE-family HTH domain